MAEIFISYRRQESTKDARSLYERLRGEFGREGVFIDLEGLDYGVDFVESPTGVHTGTRGALTRADAGSPSFELVRSAR